MTAAVVEFPRTSQIRELTDAVEALGRTTDPELKEFLSGMAVGFCAAFNSDDALQDALTDARRTPFAVCGPWSAQRVLTMLPVEVRAATVYRASGILFGYYQGTAERPDAAECTLCGRRVLTDHDEEAEECSATHGWFCDFECRRQICPPNVSAHGCWEE